VQKNCIHVNMILMMVLIMVMETPFYVTESVNLELNLCTVIFTVGFVLTVLCYKQISAATGEKT